MDELNGFDHPKTALITNESPGEIVSGVWGLLPVWAKSDFYKKANTRNAQIESLETKVSYKNSINNRCLIPAHLFYEWQWQDAKGKEKKKFEIALRNHEIFSLAGIYSIWTHARTGNRYKNYSIITTAANKLMSEIHNIKKRMPVCLDRKMDREWLGGRSLEEFAYPNYDPYLIACETGSDAADLFYPSKNSD